MNGPFRDMSLLNTKKVRIPGKVGSSVGNSSEISFVSSEGGKTAGLVTASKALGVSGVSGPANRNPS